MNKWLKQLQPLPFQDWVRRYPLERQKQLTAAHEQVRTLGFRKAYASVDCFIKNETSTTATDPRNISPRKDAFLATIGPYVSAVEHAAVSSPYLVKGCDIRERDKKLSRLLDYDFYWEIDHSRLDKNVDQTFITDFEDVLWETAFDREEHHDFFEAMKYTYWTMGLTAFAFMYFVAGTRVSGDAHTSIGNGTLCAFLQWVCNMRIPWNEWFSFHEGDDGLGAALSKWRHQIIANTMIMELFGFQLKLVLPPTIRASTFCGRSHTNIFGSLVSMCDLRRTLAKFHTTQSGLPGRRAVIAKAYSYWHTDSTSPIIGALCYTLLRVLKPTSSDVTHILRSTRLSSYEKERVLAGKRDHLGSWPNPDPELRVTADIRDGIGIDIQVAMENVFRHWLNMGIIPSEFPYICDTEIHVDDARATYMGPHYPMFVVPTHR